MSTVTPHLLRSAIVAALGSFLFGFDTAVISGTTDALRLRFLLDSNQLGFTVASALVGTIFGSIGAGKPAERYGRRPMFLIVAVLYFVSAVGSGLAWDWLSLLSFRFVGGLGVGAASVVSPMYIAEISPASLRGRLVALSQFNVVLGHPDRVPLELPDRAPRRRPRVERLAVDARHRGAAVGAVLPARAADPREPPLAGQAGPARRSRSRARRDGQRRADALVREIAESLHEESVSASEPLFQRKYRKPIMLAVAIAIVQPALGHQRAHLLHPDIFKMAGAARTSAAPAVGRSSAARTSCSRCWR